MSGSTELKRVVVAPGRLVFRGPGGHPFRPGDVVALPAAHADELVAGGHVAHEAPEPAAQS